MSALKTTLAAIISLGLFLGGIILILSPVGFWSYFLGIPAIQIGIVFIIFTFEKLSSDAIEEELASQKVQLKKN